MSEKSVKAKWNLQITANERIKFLQKNNTL
jgi:hypothetical protein